MGDLLDWALLLAGGGIGGWAAGMAYLMLTEAWAATRPDESADYMLTLTGPDGSPIRQQQMTLTGVRRIISELERRPQGYR